MGGARNTEREAQIRALVAIAQKYEVPCLPAAKAANASRQKVCELIDALKELELSRKEKSSLEQTAAYQATFPNLQQVSGNAEQAQGRNSLAAAASSWLVAQPRRPRLAWSCVGVPQKPQPRSALRVARESRFARVARPCHCQPCFE